MKRFIILLMFLASLGARLSFAVTPPATCVAGETLLDVDGQSEYWCYRDNFWLRRPISTLIFTARNQPGGFAGLDTSGHVLPSVIPQSVLDQASAHVQTVAQLPTPDASNANQLYWVSNGNSATDCTVGGGNYVVPCANTGFGTAWVAKPSGGGSGSSSASGVTFTPGWTGSTPTTLDKLTSDLSIDATLFGVSPANADNSSNFDAIFNWVSNLGTGNGQARPTKVYIPPGTYELSRPLKIPHLVQIIGAGRGDSKQLASPNGNNTVLQASSSFNGAAAFPANMLVWQGSLSTATFGEGISDLSIDCNGISGCGTFFRADCEELCYATRLNFLNFSSYGVYIFGSGNDGNATNVSGLASGSQGAQNDGPDGVWEMYPQTAAGPNTIPLVIDNDLGGRGISSVTINTLSDGTHQPNRAGWITGINLSLSHVHVEGPHRGILIGPTGVENGAAAITLSNVDAARGDSGECAVDLQNAKGVVLLSPNTPGANTPTPDGTFSVCDTKNSVNAISAFYVGDTRQSNNSNVWLSSLDGIHLDSNIYTSATLEGNHILADTELSIKSTVTPQFTIQNSTGPSFPYERFSEDTAGLLTITGSSGTGVFFNSGPVSIAAALSISAASQSDLIDLSNTDPGKSQGINYISTSGQKWFAGSNNSAGVWNVYDSTGSKVALSFAPGTEAATFTGTIVLPLKAATGTNFLCVDTNGNVVKSTTACSGT